MAEKVIMPKQGLQMTEGTIMKWLVEEGQKCEEGSPLFEMETDKLTITMDSPATGTLLKIIHKEGDVVPITETIAIIGEPGEDISNLLGSEKPESPKQKDAEFLKSVGDAYDYDVAVIGGGPGGYVSAIRCAQYGKKTIIAEKRDLGGTCLNRGCIPTKALLHSAELYHEMTKYGKKLGIEAQDITVNYKKTLENKNRVVQRLRSGVRTLLKKNQVEIAEGEAVLSGKNTFTVNGKTYKARNIILATGSEPAYIPIPGADKSGVINSDAALDLDHLPDTAVIIGGGVIGIEFATLFSTFGKQVTILEALPNILNEMDADVSDTMKRILTNRGVKIHTSAKVLEIKDGLTCVYEENGKQEEAKGDLVVMAIGRKPITKDLGLDNAGVKTTDRGFIPVDAKMQTNVPGIYAIGDITGKLQLAHVASAQGLVAAANAAGKNEEMSYDIVPACIYSNPEIASVGMTEKQSAEKKLPVAVGTFPVSSNGRSMIMNCSDGFTKLITNKKTGEILGACMVAPRATDMISEISLGMKAEATIEELASTIHPHPTVSEIIMEAAHDVEGMSCHKM